MQSLLKLLYERWTADIDGLIEEVRRAETRDDEGEADRYSLARREYEAHRITALLLPPHFY